MKKKWRNKTKKTNNGNITVECYDNFKDILLSTNDLFISRGRWRIIKQSKAKCCCKVRSLKNILSALKMS